MRTSERTMTFAFVGSTSRLAVLAGFSARVYSKLRQASDSMSACRTEHRATLGILQAREAERQQTRGQDAQFSVGNWANPLTGSAFSQRECRDQPANEFTRVGVSKLGESAQKRPLAHIVVSVGHCCREHFASMHVTRRICASTAVVGMQSREASEG